MLWFSKSVFELACGLNCFSLNELVGYLHVLPILFLESLGTDSEGILYTTLYYVSQ